MKNSKRQDQISKFFAGFDPSTNRNNNTTALLSTKFCQITTSASAISSTIRCLSSSTRSSISTPCNKISTRRSVPQFLWTFSMDSMEQLWHMGRPAPVRPTPCREPTRTHGRTRVWSPESYILPTHLDWRSFLRHLEVPREPRVQAQSFHLWNLHVKS